MRVSLELQDRTIESLRTCVVDDVHLSVTIADLLQLLTSNIRTRFLRFAPTERPGDSTGGEMTLHAPSRNQTPNPQEQAQEYANSKWQHNHTSQGPGGLSFDHTNNHPSNHNQNPMTTQDDPLANIPAQPINSSNLNVSFMPPPSSVYYNYYDPTTASLKADLEDSTISPQALTDSNGAVPGNPVNSSGGGNNTNNNSATTNNTLSDWFALPLDQFFNSSTADVDQGLGGTGPMVGEYDMLEVLLKEQNDDSLEAGGDGGNQLGQLL